MIQNPGQITQPSIDLKAVLKRKSAKDFKKVSPICGNLSYKSQLMKVWAVLSWNLIKKFVCKIQNSGQITQPNIDLKVVLKRKLAKDFKKVGPICSNLSFKSQLMKVWEVLSFLGKFQLKTAQTHWHFFLSNWCGSNNRLSNGRTM